jgi:hypothetical protein
MIRRPAEQERLHEIARFCQQAIQEQRDRERGLGYGLDDYTEGRIVGGANLARKILRALTGEAGGSSASVRRGRRSLAG